MAKLSPLHLWRPQVERYQAIFKSDPVSYRAVREKFRQLGEGDENIYNHEAMQMALDSVIGPEEFTVSLSRQADEYEETIKAEEIIGGL